ncbi:MAG: hypothetical protein PHY72_02370 [Candidatus Pacebacteria bacterium]|nr:hypothetical protein [Candidatus Paceibacterota bacterium]
MSDKFDVLNIIPKPKIVLPFWVNPLVLASGVILLIMTGLFVFYHFQALSWESKAKVEESNYLALATPENKAIEEKAGKISQQLEKFFQAFENHKFSYILFNFLKDNCHPNVSFSSLNFNSNSGKVSLAGQTNNYNSLGEQIAVLKSVKEISALEVSDIVLDKEGNVTFRLNFIVDPNFFKNQNQ